MIAACVLCSAMCAMPFVDGPWAAILCASVSLAGGGASFALLTADMIARVHPAHASTAGGLTAAAQSLAYVVTGPAVGAVVDRTHSYAQVLIILGGMAPLVGVAWALWPIAASTERDLMTRNEMR